MPTYKNVSDQPIDWVTTGHMEPGDVKSIADDVSHPSLERVDDNEATNLQATEPKSDQAPLTAELQPPAPSVPAPQPAPAQIPQPTQAPQVPAPAATPPAPNNNVNPQGA